MGTKDSAPARAIVIQCGGHGEVRIDLNATKTAEAIFQALPMRADAETWGEEVYFSLPLSIAQEKGTRDVAVGDVGWWPPGSAMAIFFGRTPASSGPKPVPASAVTVIGRVAGGLDVLRKVEPGDKLELTGG
jgi:uncharacterized protein